MKIIIAFAAMAASTQAVKLAKWTDMDSAIRDAESSVLFGAQDQEDKRKKGLLTTLSGFNDAYDPSVTKYAEAGDPAMDDEFLQKVFHNYYTRAKDEKGFQTGKKVLTKGWAREASRDVVMNWGHMTKEDAEAYLQENFEATWEHYDVNNEGQIPVPEAYNMEKSLMGSFSITYS